MSDDTHRHYMLITPEVVGWLRVEAILRDARELARACDAFFTAGTATTGTSGKCADPVVEQICADGWDAWRATDATDGEDREIDGSTRRRIEDLHHYALCADNRRAQDVCRLAMKPEAMGWIPTTKEVEARRACLVAWNRRAARLRAAGVAPLPPRVGWDKTLRRLGDGP